MARQSSAERAVRVVRFLMGLHQREIVRGLAGCGFRREDLEEGWRLLRGVGSQDVEVGPPVDEGGGRDALARIGAWRKRWFPIARASLERRAPTVGEWLFEAAPAHGPSGAVMDVMTFVARAAELRKPKGRGSHGAEAVEALRVLERRGLSRAVLAEAEALVAEVRTLRPPEPGVEIEPSEEALAERARADEALWGWYREWSQIARKVIRNRNHLRQLGLSPGGAGDDEEGSAAPERPEEERSPGKKEPSPPRKRRSPR